MAEYLITGSDEPGGGLGVHVDDLARVLCPAGWVCAQVEGWGDFRVAVDETEVAYSWDDPGWHVIVDGDMTRSAAHSFVQGVARQLASWTGQSSRVVEL